MACDGCAKRRQLIALHLEAMRLWALNPTGPRHDEILANLRKQLDTHHGKGD